MTRSEFNNLVHTISRILYGHAYRILRNQAGSEDAVQEIFVKLWRMNERLEEYESVSALAAKMVKNYCIDQLRRQKHIEEDDKDTFNMVPDSDLSPHEKIERKETYNIIHRIISNLPEMYREIIRLRDIEEQSYEEIAAKTGQNINTLRVNISRARRIIRDEYKKHNDEFRGNKTIA